MNCSKNGRLCRLVAVAGLGVCLAAGGASAQPTVDGRLDPQYGVAQWVNTTPTQFGDAAPPQPCVPIGTGISIALNNTNRAGVTGSFPVAVLTPAQAADAAAVTTGIEIKIPLADIGNPAGTIRIAGFVTNGNYGTLSSQVIGGINGSATFGGYPGTGTVNFASDALNQFVTVPAAVTPGAPTLDGQLDASFYGTAAFVQDTTTNFGDSTTPVVPTESIYRAPSGSEIAAVYVRRTATDVYLFVAGNLESNFNKLALLVDTGAVTGAQNVILNTNNNNGGITDGGANALAGMTLDAGFSASHFLSVTVGGGPETMFVDFQRLGTQAEGGASRSLRNGGGVTANPYDAQGCPPPAPPSADIAGGSELGAVYATVCGSTLYLLVTGNLETNGNWLDLFFDVGTTQIPLPGSTGQNRILPGNVTVGEGALQQYAEDPADPLFNPGVRFSADFAADYFVGFRNVGDPVDVFAVAANLNTGGALNDGLPVGNPARPSLLEYGSFVGGPKASNSPLSFDGQLCVRPVPVPPMGTCQANGIGTFWNPASLPGIDIQGDASGSANNPLLVPVIPDIFSSYAPRLISANAFDPLNRGTPAFPVANPSSLAVPGLLRIAINNSNRAGVTSASGTGGASVVTGVEYAINLAELGYGGSGPIRLTGWIASGSRDFVSNQVIGGQLASTQGNLGAPRIIDFTGLPPQGSTGPFYVTLSPGTCSAAASGACCIGDNTVCAVLSPAQCTAAAGAYSGNGTVCETSCGNQPATGRCCIGARCVIVAQAQCTPSGTAGAAFSASGQNCNASGTFNNPCCFADYNKAGGITVQDIFDFLTDYFSGSVNANVQGNGTALPTVQDIFDYLTAYFAAGC